MKILSVEKFTAEDLFSRLRQTRLRGYGGAQPYQNSSIALRRSVGTADLTPAQNYVMAPGVRKVLELRSALLDHKIDIFDLNGGAFVTTSEHPDERIPVIPPIVEESKEPDGRSVLLINDGMHRVFAARSCDLPISIILIQEIPSEYPYYAYALPGGWGSVTSLEELPETYQKKEYRQPTGYKALFRDFNALFPGVQKERRSSNPSHIKI